MTSSNGAGHTVGGGDRFVLAYAIAADVGPCDVGIEPLHEAEPHHQAGVGGGADA